MELKYPLPLTKSDHATLSNFLEKINAAQESDLAAEKAKKKAFDLHEKLTASVASLDKRFADGDLDCPKPRHD